MLSVAKLSPGQEAYYERSVAAGIDDYYAGRGESPGVWVGRGAAELELDGVVGEGELGRLIGGKHPLTSAELRRHPPKKQITVERIDPADRRARARGEDALAGRGLRPRVLAAEERQPPARARQRRGAPRGEPGAPRRLAGGALLPRAAGVRDAQGQERRAARARPGLRRGRLSAPHLAGAGSAPAYARDRREHGARLRRRLARARRRADA